MTRSSLRSANTRFLTKTSRGDAPRRPRTLRAGVFTLWVHDGDPTTSKSARQHPPRTRFAARPARGSRYCDVGERRNAVLARCTVEFAKRWPAIDPASVAPHVQAVLRASALSGAARRAIFRLLEDVRSCLEIAEQDEGTPHLSYVAELREAAPQLRAVRDAFRSLPFVKVDAANPAGPRGLMSLHVFREVPYSVTFREAVFWAFTSGISNLAALPTARDLAVASLLAGQEIHSPRRNGTTASEVIIKETKAMREVARNRGWVESFLKPTSEDSELRVVDVTLLPDCPVSDNRRRFLSVTPHTRTGRHTVRA
jgi:hypothetical protein